MHEQIESLKKRRGRISINKKFIIDEPDERLLKAFFSVFFPVSITPLHEANWFDQLFYFGYSPLFKEMDEQTMYIPQYQATFVYPERKSADEPIGDITVTFKEINNEKGNE